jgi:beta-lactamase class D
MKLFFVFSIVSIVFASCTEREPIPFLPAVRSEIYPDTLFSGYTGSFLLWQLGSDTLLVYNDSLNHIRTGPASTFKIPHAVIALQTGVVSPEENTKTWDGQKKAIPSWEADHTLRSALEHSVVWYFQETARDIGEDRMRTYLRSFDYGDGNIGERIDMFWLDGSLKISPYEQLSFMYRFYNELLPVETRYLRLVKDYLIQERTETYIYGGKTGTVRSPRMGWFTGYLENSGETYLFVTRVSGDENVMGSHARDITRKLIQSLKLIEQ